MRCNKPDLSSINDNATINSTLKNSKQEESEAANGEISSKQQSLSKARKRTVNSSKRAGRRIKNK